MNEIVIFSEDKDLSTNDVMLSLIKLNKKVIRINYDDENLNLIELSVNSCILNSSWGLKLIKPNSVVWFRRFPVYKMFLFSKNENESGFNYYDRIHSTIEKSESISSLVFWLLENCICFNNPISDININKTYTLNIAAKLKINVPKTLITNQSNNVVNFFDCDKIIMKSFHTFKYIDGNEIILKYAELIDKISLQETEIFNKPYIFQEYIDKKYEIRSFFWDDTFFSMAIFSQQNLQTKIDFRNYDRDTPNRTEVFNLPISLKNKLVKLCKILKLRTGSFDIIKTVRNKYVLLEVNPFGQFGMVSKPCQYNIENFIATKLMKYAEK